MAKKEVYMFLLSSSLMLISCSSSTLPPESEGGQATLTTSIEPFATNTNTSLPPTPTLTASTLEPTMTIPSEVSVSSTPDFLASSLANNFVFAPSTDPDCQLPCWQGLRVGESDRDDIQAMFETVFGFDESVRFFEDESLIRWPPFHPIDIPGTQASGYVWNFDPEEGGGFQIFPLIDTETEILQGIFIPFVRANFDIHNHTPQQIIMELGTPSYIFISIEPVLFTEDIASTFWLVYKQGMMFEFYFRMPTEIRVKDGKEEKVVSYCLDKPVSPLGIVALVAPFDGLWGDDLSLIQQRWIKDVVDKPEYVSPAEEVFGLTLEQIADVARQDENPCIELDVTYLYE